MAYQLLKHTTVIGSRRLASTTIRHEVAIASRHHINVTSRHGVNITSVYGRANVRWFRATAYASGILKSKLPELAIPTDVSLAEYVMSDFDHHGDSVAMVEGVSNKSYTYRQLKDLVHRCGSGLSKAGFQQGDVCALFKPNMPEYFISFYSVAAIGGTITTVNPLYSADEFMHQLNDCKATWIVTSTDNSDKAKDAAKKTTHPVKGIYVIGDECVGGCIPFTDLMKDDGSDFPTNVQINPMEDVVALPYSSGTTGLPKGVMLTHHNLIANIEQMKSPGLLDFKAGDTLISVVPFFHIYGMAVILSNGLKLGTKLITLPKFEPEQFLQTIETYKVNHGMLVPPLMVFLAKHPLVDQYDLSSLEFVLFGAAPIGGDVINAVKKRLKNDTLFFRQAYGLTETSPIATMCSAHHDFHIGSVGLLVANSDAKVIDTKTGETLGVGENGELCFRGPHVMKGYLKNEKATKATLKDGWLHSGDIGHYDNTGHFFVVDRLKEIIKYKGFQVAPAELEALLLTHPDIQDSAVIAKPDEDAGELPKAFVVPKNKTLSPQDVETFIADKVSPHKKLRGGVEFIEEIPKSASGKILRRRLRTREIENMKNESLKK